MTVVLWNQFQPLGFECTRGINFKSRQNSFSFPNEIYLVKSRDHRQPRGRDTDQEIRHCVLNKNKNWKPFISTPLLMGLLFFFCSFFAQPIYGGPFVLRGPVSQNKNAYFARRLPADTKMPEPIIVPTIRVTPLNSPTWEKHVVILTNIFFYVN